MTGPLTALERIIEGVVERPVARLFRVAVEPEAVVRALERALGAAASRGRPVPGRWVVRLDPRSALLDPAARDELEPWAAESIRRVGSSRGWTFAEHPEVQLIADPDVGRGAVEVEPGPAGIGDPLAGIGDPLAGIGDPSAGIGDPSAGPVTLDLADAAVGGAQETVPRAAIAVEVLRPGRPPVRQELPLRDLTIGRGRSAGLRIPEPTVSRAHGRLTIRQGILVYVDLGSRNGSRLHGLPVDEVAVGVGDRIELGAAAIRVVGLR